MTRRRVRRFSVALIAACSALVTSCAGMGKPIQDRDVRPGCGVSAQRRLSDYAPGLRGGPGDCPVYILDSGRPGATLLVVGGTHGDEIAGMTAAVLLVERAVPLRGRMIVIPRLNSSGLRRPDGSGAPPYRIRLDAASGIRYIPRGARLVHPDDQGIGDSPRPPGPPTEEDRNINRAYPGSAGGSLTQRVAAAVMDLIRRENVAVAVDMHETAPGSEIAWTIVANPKNLDAAVFAVFQLEDDGIRMRLDQSSVENRGFSHREWGDRTGAQAFLIETVNPAQGASDGRAVDPLSHPAFPLWKRVAIHLETLSALVDGYNAVERVVAIEYEGIPAYKVVEKLGLEAFF